MEIGHFFVVVCILAVSVNGQVTLEQVNSAATANGALLSNIRNNQIPSIINQIASINNVINDIKLSITLLQASDAENNKKIDALAVKTSDTNSKTNQIQQDVNQLNEKVDALSNTVNPVNEKIDEIKLAINKLSDQTGLIGTDFENIGNDVNALAEAAQDISDATNGLQVDTDGKIDSALNNIYSLNRLVRKTNKRINDLNPKAVYKKKY